MNGIVPIAIGDAILISRGQLDGREDRGREDGGRGRLVGRRPAGRSLIGSMMKNCFALFRFLSFFAGEGDRNLCQGACMGARARAARIGVKGLDWKIFKKFPLLIICIYSRLIGTSASSVGHVKVLFTSSFPFYFVVPSKALSISELAMARAH